MSINVDGTYDFSNESAETKMEIQIRGRYAMMACDIEFCLFNLIAFCNPDPHNHERIGQFSEMQMAAKINNAVCDMKKYKLAYYEEFKEYFDGLQEFKDVRNDMAHCIGKFTDEKLSVFRITYAAKTDPKNKANKDERMMYKDYTSQYIEESLNRFAKINQKLAMLWFRLKYEFDQKSETHPFVHPSANKD